VFIRLLPKPTKSNQPARGELVEPSPVLSGVASAKTEGRRAEFRKRSKIKAPAKDNPFINSQQELFKSKIGIDKISGEYFKKIIIYNILINIIY